MTTESQKSPKRNKWKDTIRDLPRQLSFDFKDSNLSFSPDSIKLSQVDCPPGSDTPKYVKNTARLYQTLAERRRPREAFQLDVYNSTRRQAINPQTIVSLKEVPTEENSIDV